MPEISETLHHVGIDGVQVELAVARVTGRGADRGDALITGFGTAALSDGCLVRIHNEDLLTDILDGDSPDYPRRSLQKLAHNRIQQEGAGILINLNKHGKKGREGGGIGLESLARARHLTDTEGVGLGEAYQRLGLKGDRLTYYNTSRLLQERLGLSAIRLLISEGDSPATNQRMIEALGASGLDITPIPLEVQSQPRRRSLRDMLHCRK